MINKKNERKENSEVQFSGEILILESICNKKMYQNLTYSTTLALQAPELKNVVKIAWAAT